MAYTYVIFIAIYIITVASPFCKADKEIKQINTDGLYEKAFIEEYGSNNTLDEGELQLLLEDLIQRCKKVPEGETESPGDGTVSSVHPCTEGSVQCRNNKVCLYLSADLSNYSPLGKS